MNKMSAKGMLSILFIASISWYLSSLTLAQKPTTMSESEALIRSTTAYIYGYPLLAMDITKQMMTNAITPQGTHAPIGQFINLRQYPTAAYHEITAPNADTLYSFAWLNLDKEPYILHVPDEHARYYLMVLISAWSEILASIGTRTTGTSEQDFVIVGPHWHGKLPEGLKVLNSPTDMVWVYGRTYSTGTAEDYKIVHDIQDKYQLTPLSFYGKPYTPPKGRVDPKVNMKTSVPDQVNALPAAIYFKRLAMLMKDNPPAKEDQPMIENLAKLGIFPGKNFDINKVNPVIAKALAAAVKIAQTKIIEHKQVAGVNVKGWNYITKAGKYGTDYLQRALMAEIGLGVSLPQDALYPETSVDSSGNTLNGAHTYLIRFAQDGIPPVNGFWSLTMYDNHYFFTPNSLNRYNISQRNALTTNADGSITIYIQHDSPGAAKESNWLPAPKGDFILMFRFFWPKNAIVDGTWTPPGVKEVYKVTY